ncbi:Cytochrome P450 [Quillaja saponaria]|uniref:Cytochrome P450 n=1 Tax=Quillaja saponaria TaxID=32244 RepID=A0AAD7KV59_QUISA|nr:Cytochrome P450 [Quillaja saponaria]
MEVLSFSYFTTFFLLFILLWFVKNWKKSRAQKQLPGPWKLPVIGNLHNLAGSLPHHVLRDLARKHGPLMHLQLGEISAVVVSSPLMAKEVMKTHDLAFASRPELLASKIVVYGGKDIAFAPYGGYWREMRKLATLELLSVKRVQSFSFIRKDEVNKLIESIHSSVGSPINLTKKIYSMTSTISSRAAFGAKCPDQDKFVSLIKSVTTLAAGFDLADLFPSLKLIHFITGLKGKLEKIQKEAGKIVDTIIDEHREQAKHGKFEDEDLVDVLLRVQQAGSLDIEITTNSMKAVIWDLFSGGTDTSSTIIEWAMSEMMKSPRVMKKAQAEIRQAFKGKKEIHETDLEKLHYLKSVIKETFRLHPPAPLLLPRENRSEACKIDGYEIPIQTKVIVNAWAIGRDPKYWHDAESFIPDRFSDNTIDFKGTNFEFIPFGAGRRMCPGIAFGLANIELPLASLLYYFNWELPNKMKPEDLDMTEAIGVNAGRKNNLYLYGTSFT